MFCDVFNKKQARQLLEGKRIWFIGSSNMRAIYKDILWLVNNGDLASQTAFKVKNEPSYLNDKLLSNDTLHNGRNYKETREYKSKNIYLFFHFVTRLYQDHFIDLIRSITPETTPDIIFLNSCLWDLSRWGPDGPKQFRENIMRTMKFLKTELPAKTRVIWKTTLPVSTSADGAIFVDEIKFIVPMLPWHILEANVYAATCANFFSYDTLDFHHYMRLQGHLRVKDGIHWSPNAVRYLTNIFLTHLSLCWGRKLPGNFTPKNKYLTNTTKIAVQQNQIEERINKKSGFFDKLLSKFKNNDKKTKGPLAGIKNKILAAGNIFKRKKKTKNDKVKKDKVTKILDYFSNKATSNSNNLVNFANLTTSSCNNYFANSTTSNSNNFDNNYFANGTNSNSNNFGNNYFANGTASTSNNFVNTNNTYEYQSPLLRLANDFYRGNNYYSQYNYPDRRW